MDRTTQPQPRAACTDLSIQRTTEDCINENGNVRPDFPLAASQASKGESTSKCPNYSKTIFHWTISLQQPILKVSVLAIWSQTKSMKYLRMWTAWGSWVGLSTLTSIRASSLLNIHPWPNLLQHMQPWWWGGLAIQVQGMAAVRPAILPTRSKSPNCSRLGERLNSALYAISFLSHQKGETQTCPNCMSSDHSDIHCALACQDEGSSPGSLGQQREYTAQRDFTGTGRRSKGLSCHAPSPNGPIQLTRYATHGTMAGAPAPLELVRITTYASAVGMTTKWLNGFKSHTAAELTWTPLLLIVKNCS